MSKNKNIVIVITTPGDEARYHQGRSFNINDHGLLEVYNKSFDLIGLHKTWTSAHLTNQ